MPNPFRSISPMQRVMQLAQQAQQVQADPSQIGKILLESGRINNDTYNAIKEMKSPSQIGNYLLNNGILGQQQMNQLSQMIPQAQQFMK